MNYKKKFLLYLIQFYTGFLSQRRHLQMKVGDTKKDYRSVCSWLRFDLELNIFNNKYQNGGLVKKNRNFFRWKSVKKIIIIMK